MGNMSSIIKQHKRNVLGHNNKTAAPTKECNCRTRNKCPLNGACLERNLVYKATVSTEQETKTYIRMTENEFKFRFNNHKTSFKHKKHAMKTALSKYIWDLKENHCAYSINWSILKHAKPCNSGSNNCNLCTTEKLCILNANIRFHLNKRSELIFKCRHDNKFYVNSLRF